MSFLVKKKHNYLCKCFQWSVCMLCLPDLKCWETHRLKDSLKIETFFTVFFYIMANF